MKYKVGDRVRIKSIDWYNNNKDEDGYVDLRLNTRSRHSLHPDMSVFCGKIVTIISISEHDHAYDIKEDNGEFYWTDEMIEGLVEEESKPKYEDEVNGEYYSTPKYLVRPSGYQFVDENGNVINARKIILEKKKKEYPKTYEECSLITGYEDRIPLKIIGEFTRLINARNAYWKLYGEEMGLGKPWKPDYNEESYEQGSPIKYVIYYTGTHIAKERKCTPCYILSFPTAEMRDEFYENFKKEIEICKELL